MQKISLSQRETKEELKGEMDGLKAHMEANMDGMESKIDGVEEKLEGLKECLTLLLQEKLPNGEKVVEETDDENKINFNNDFIDSNVGLKNHHIPNIDTRMFDCKDPITWILEMEQYFDLHNVQQTQNVHIATLYLEPNQLLGYQWLSSHKFFFTWSILQRK